MRRRRTDAHVPPRAQRKLNGSTRKTTNLEFVGSCSFVIFFLFSEGERAQTHSMNAFLCCHNDFSCVNDGVKLHLPSLLCPSHYLDAPPTPASIHLNLYGLSCRGALAVFPQPRYRPSPFLMRLWHLQADLSPNHDDLP